MMLYYCLIQLCVLLQFVLPLELYYPLISIAIVVALYRQYNADLPIDIFDCILVFIFAFLVFWLKQYTLFTPIFAFGMLRIALSYIPSDNDGYMSRIDARISKFTDKIDKNDALFKEISEKISGTQEKLQNLDINATKGNSDSENKQIVELKQIIESNTSYLKNLVEIRSDMESRLKEKEAEAEKLRLRLDEKETEVHRYIEMHNDNRDIISSYEMKISECKALEDNLKKYIEALHKDNVSNAELQEELRSIRSQTENIERKHRQEVEALQSKVKQEGNTIIGSDRIVDEFKDVFLSAKTEICIMSPQISERVYHNYLKESIANTLGRGVRIRIIYGLPEIIRGKIDNDDSTFVANLMKKGFPVSYWKQSYHQADD